MNADARDGRAGAMDAQLRLETSGDDAVVFPLHPGRNSVGRAADCEVALNDPTVSEHHCEIELTPHGARVTDRGSTNGTRLDGEPVREAPLQAGQMLQLGDLTLQFEEVPVEGRPSGAPRSSPGNGEAESRSRIFCAHHVQTRAAWVCGECHKPLCGACVKQVSLGKDRPVTLCRSCDGLCERLGKPGAVGSPARNWMAGLAASLGYPLHGTAFVLLLVNGLLSIVAILPLILRSDRMSQLRGGAGMLAVSGMVGYGFVFVGIAVGLYGLAYLREIVASSGEGAVAPPTWPELDFDSLRERAVEMLGVGLVAFGPWLLSSIWLREAGTQWGWVGKALLALGISYFPLALLGVVIYDSFAAVNPLLVAVSAMRVPLPYLMLVVFIGALTGIEHGLEAAAGRSEHAVLAALAGSVAWPYVLIVVMRAIGWFYWCHKERLAWD
jgi:hypothetical protein